MIKKFLFTAIFLATFVGTALAQTPNMGFTWAEPDSGNAAVGYTVELFKAGAFFSTTDVDTNYFEFEAEPFIEYQIRVAGFDANGDTGEFSVPSDIEIFTLGPPGKPGKPYRTF
jgi:hypothetical protein